MTILETGIAASAACGEARELFIGRRRGAGYFLRVALSSREGDAT